MTRHASIAPQRAIALLTLLATGICQADPQLKEPVVFNGMCDASAAAAVDARRFIVADDEDNVLRVYSRSGGGALSEVDVSEFLGNQGKKKSKEADLEAAAQLGGHVFWIASHGRNSKGKAAPERQRLFATKVAVHGTKVEITPIGQPYRLLLSELARHKALQGYDLAAAAELAPKAPGGLNIEGLAATSDGRLLIGFRSPVRDGKALVVPLLNPLEVLNGRAANFGEPAALDLHGLGIRSMERVGSRYIIIAGAIGDAPDPARLFWWDGHGQPQIVRGITLGGLNPEGIAFHTGDGAGEYFILSDDGTRDVAGKDCKDLKDPALKHFRGRVIAF